MDKKYSHNDLVLLSGKVRNTRYIADVQAILKKWGIEKTDNYVAQVVHLTKDGKFKNYNEAVWDAIVLIINDRKKRQRVSAKAVAEALAD
ncbi:hypothetical protein [Spirosoma sp.]|uniref:hypothetical protein n=1 Tax=Spirosoma sp. TaxID=1899569 RepID=UPI002618E136|nr:hypothetical protein [Spirosoma sp.]MCX6217698.1 hypothetical protein [Spirosoma sp.]